MPNRHLCSVKEGVMLSKLDEELTWRGAFEDIKLEEKIRAPM